MANYATLKSAIQNVVKTNGNNEITGALLQQSLLAMVDSLGANYQFVGVAQPSTNPGTPDQNVFYIAGSGTYVNFGNTTVPVGQLGFFKYNGSWTYETVPVGANYDSEFAEIQEQIDEIESEIDKSTIRTYTPTLLTGAGVRTPSIEVQPAENLWYIPVKANKGYSMIFNNGIGSARYGFCSTRPAVGVSVSNYSTFVASDVRSFSAPADGFLVVSAVNSNPTPTITTVKQGGIGLDVSALQETDGYSVRAAAQSIVSGYFISATNGQLISSTSANNRGVSDYIAVIPGWKLKIIAGVFQPGNTAYAYCVFYSNNLGEFVSSVVGTAGEISNVEITVPQNAKYVRVFLTNPNTAAQLINKKSIDERLTEVETELANIGDVTETVETVNALVTHVPQQIFAQNDFNAVGLYDAAQAQILTSYANYRALPLLNVVEGQTIVWHKWQHGGSIMGSAAAIFCYDNDGLPYDGVSARVNYERLTTKDYTTGEFTFVIPSNCSQIGLCYNFTAYPLQTGAQLIVSDDKYELTNLAKELVNNAVESADVVGGDSAKYYLKGNSNIVYSSQKKLGIIAAGQSNIDGRNSYSDLPAGFVNPNSKVKFSNNENGTFVPFEVTDGGAGNDWSFDAIVYDLLTKAAYGNQDEIFVMKKSMGGTSIDQLGATDYHWTADYEFLTSPTYSLLRTFESVIRAGINTQGSNFDIKAMLWHQGEGDMQIESVAKRYYENLKNMLAYVRGIIGNPRLHVFCGNISLNRTTPGYVEIINAAYTKLASEDPYLHVVDMSNAGLEDGYHFNYQWSIYFGQKVYDMMIDAGIITGTKINPTEPS